MLLGRIIGNVVCTMKDPALVGQKLLIVQPLDRKGRDKGRPVIALDAVGAGAGETIYWCRGKEASFPFLPVDLTPRDGRLLGANRSADPATFSSRFNSTARIAAIQSSRLTP